MKLKTLSLVNYRGFEQLEIKFQDDVNVIAGVNGVGKSSILHVICAMAARILNEISPAKYRYFPINNEDIFEGQISTTFSSVFTHQKQSFQFGGRESNSEFLAILHQEYIERNTAWENAYQAELDENIEEKRKVLKVESERLKQLELQVSEKINNASEGWNIRVALRGEPALVNTQFIAEETPKITRSKSENPLVVYFSSGRQVFQMPTKLNRSAPLSVAKAYSDALIPRVVDMGSFMHWFRVQEELGGERRAQILTALKQVATEFAGFSDLRIDLTPRLRFMVQKSNMWLSVSQLSDGERGILAIIFDLTRRLTLANPDLADPIANGEAIVLIDELELHLHPSWQRQALRRLKNTFKNCQFIVTTHSPQVIGEVEATQFILLGREDGKVIQESVTQSLGMDSNWILRQLMDTSERDEVTQQELKAIQKAITTKNLSESRRLITQLEFRRGIFAALQASKSLLERLELLEQKNAKDSQNE
jgi:predicted ATP-binding protein involved in virulence